MKRLLVCLLLVGVVGCGKSEQVAHQPSGETLQNEQQQSEARRQQAEKKEALRQKMLAEQEAIAALREFGGAFGTDEDGNVGEIDLSGTEITDAALVHLKELKKLESLRLNDTKITDAGLVHLKGLTKLGYLKPFRHPSH